MFKIFGKRPSGTRLARIKQSPNYRDGIFQNLSKTTVINPDASILKLWWMMWQSRNIVQPARPLPFVKTDLHNLPDGAPVLVWFGHSSYLLKLDGKLLLIDPVLSGNAAPFSLAVKAFPGADEYHAEDMPDPDVLVLTHDHYDHLDYKTIMRMKNRIKQVICPLGVGAHLEYWGLDKNIITEMDWWDSAELAGFQFTATPARHFSGRGLIRAKALWTSFVLTGGGYRIFIGGDSGYDTHFKTIGERFGPFDLVILEIGQYNTMWPLIHVAPEETVQAALDLQAKLLLPVHWAKFALAYHPWDEPILRVLAKAAELNLSVATPLIGEPLILGQPKTVDFPHKKWWEPVGRP